MAALPPQNFTGLQRWQAQAEVLGLDSGAIGALHDSAVVAGPANEEELG